MNIDKLKGFIDLIGKGDSSRVSYFFNKHKERIHAGLLERLEKEPRTPYLRFVLETPEGHQRSWLYVEAFGKALAGDINFFLMDQENIGKIRAIEGHKIQDIIVLIIALKEITDRVKREGRLQRALLTESQFTKIYKEVIR